jgi:hypothetical protein
MSECNLLFRVTPATAIANNTTDFFTALSLPSSTGSRIVTVSVALDTAVKLYARLNATNQVLNNDTALTANALYTFSFIMSGSDTLTFRVSAACAVNYMVGVTSLE